MQGFSRHLSLALAAATLLVPPGLSRRCMLANPSFEGSASRELLRRLEPVRRRRHRRDREATAAALRVRPNTGNWDISGYWRRRRPAGDRWKAAGYAACPLPRRSRATQGGRERQWRNSEGHSSATGRTTSPPRRACATRSSRVLVHHGGRPSGTTSARLVLAGSAGPRRSTARRGHDRSRSKSRRRRASTRWWEAARANSRTVSFSGPHVAREEHRCLRPGAELRSLDRRGLGGPERAAAPDDQESRRHVGTAPRSRSTARSSGVGTCSRRAATSTRSIRPVFGLFVWGTARATATQASGGTLQRDRRRVQSLGIARRTERAVRRAASFDWGATARQFAMSFSTDGHDARSAGVPTRRVPSLAWWADAGCPRTWCARGRTPGRIPRPDQPQRAPQPVAGDRRARRPRRKRCSTCSRFRQWPTAFLGVDDAPPAPVTGASLAIASRNPAATARRCAARSRA